MTDSQSYPVTEQTFLEDNIATVAFHLGQPGARLSVSHDGPGLVVDPGEVLKEISRRLSGVAQAGWQPIETAPRDGTKLLLCYATPKMAASALPVLSGHWSLLSDCWFSAITDDRINPSHWQPLPTPPVPSTSLICPDCGRDVDGPTHAAYCAVSSTDGATP